MDPMLGFDILLVFTSVQKMRLPLKQLSLHYNLIQRLGKERKMLQVEENHEYNEKDGINSVQSSLMSHPFWVTLSTRI